MLQKNIWTGILFLIGITAGSWKMGLATIIATVIGTYTAILLNFEKKEIDDGIYGFSAALVGAAGMFFFQSTLIIWTLIFLGAVLAAIIQNFFIRIKIPAYTLPFVLITWLFLYLVPLEFHSNIISSTPNAPKITDFIFTNFGQVIFQDQVWIGFLFLIAVAIADVKAALFGVFGGIIASVIFYLSWTTFNEISIGIYGFNAVLCAIAFAGGKKKNVFWALMAVIISISISLIFFRQEYSQLTFPFVIGSAIISIIKND